MLVLQVPAVLGGVQGDGLCEPSDPSIPDFSLGMAAADPGRGKGVLLAPGAMTESDSQYNFCADFTDSKPGAQRWS